MTAPAARAPFAPSPRPEPSLRIKVARTMRILGNIIGCYRRAAACPRLYTRASPLVWRWLCQPAGAPREEG